MLRAGQRRKFVRLTGTGTAGGAMPFPSFYLPLNDLGAGAVNTVPAIASGSAVVTFTRASIDWTKLASGLWAPVGAGIARSHYLGRDTAIGAYGGFLPEAAGTQLVTPTAAIRDMTDASWVKVGITSAKTATGIDGVPNSASTLTATAPGGTILQTLIAAATSRTYSLFLRRKTGSGTITLQQLGTTQDITAQLNSVTYTRVQVNASVLNVAFGIIMGTSGDVIEADFNQFEPLAASQFATSPMASTGAARAADVFNLQAAGNISFTQGTAYAELSTNWTTADIIRIAMGVTNGYELFAAVAQASTAIAAKDGTSTTTKAGLPDMSAGVVKCASSWAGVGAINMAVTGSGLAAQLGTFDGNMGPATGGNFCIGHVDGTNQWNGTLKEIRIAPTVAQLQAMTA